MIVIDKRDDGAGSFKQLPKNPTWEQVKELFKIGSNERLGWTATPNGQTCWRFVGVTINEGPAVYQVKISDTSGELLPSILALRHFPGSPAFPGPIAPAYFSSGEATFTDKGGDKFGIAEFAYAAGSVTGPNGGPDSFWVSASPPGQEPQYSDLATGFGWLGGTNHLNPSPIFQEVLKTPDVPPTGDYHLDIIVAGEVVGTIAIQEPGPGGDNYMALFSGEVELGRVKFE